MKPFIPQPLPIDSVQWEAIIELMGKANRELARYDGLLLSVPNPHVLLAPLRTQEAVLSSKIEGTQATLEEVLDYDAGSQKQTEKRDDIGEVVNYRWALNYAIKEMEDKPITLNMLRNIHDRLLQGVRGENKDRGNFRRIQNWIGSAGSGMEQARFVPPTVPKMTEGLHNWELYIHSNDKDFLVQLAVIHAQFEILHPFLDGNGRMGRMLVPLFLYYKQVIHQPVFYLSDYLEMKRQAYYDGLKNITDSGNWTEWISFFLTALTEQAKKNSEKVKAMLGLYNEMKQKIVDSTHSQFGIKIIDYLFSYPVFNTTAFLESTSIPKATGARILNALTEAAIIQLREKGGARKPSVYVFRDILRIVNK